MTLAGASSRAVTLRARRTLMLRRSNSGERLGGVRPGGVARLVILAGGAFACLARYAQILKADMAILLDVSEEVNRVAAAANVVRVALATSETLATLCQAVSSPAELLARISKLPGVTLDRGLCQVRAVGAMAVKQLLKQPAFGDFLDEALTRLLMLHNGSLDRVEIIVLSSTAGGTGAPCGPVIGQAFVQTITEHSDAVVDLHFLRAGSLSYLGLGKAAQVNDAADIAEIIEEVTSPIRHPREVRSLDLAELPIAGQDQVLRDQYAREFVQAYLAEGVQTLLNRTQPNVALTSEWGAVSLFEVGWGASLSSGRVAAETASQYLSEVKELLSTPPGGVDAIEVVIGQNAFTHEFSEDAIRNLIRTSGKVRPDDLLARCTRLQASCATVAVRARVDGQSIDLANGPLPVRIVCRSTGDFRKKLSVLSGLEQRIATETGVLRQQLAALEGDRRRAFALLEQADQKLYPIKLRERVLRVFANPQAILVTFRNALQHVRDLDLRIARLRAQAAALEEIRGRFAADLETTRKQLAKAVDLLAAVRLTGDGASSPRRLVRVAPLDTVMEAMIELASAPKAERSAFVELLASAAEAVTLDGLALITQAREPRLDLVANQLVRGEAVIALSPPCGGRRPTSEGDRIVVLPPVESSLADELRGMLKELSPGFVVAFADTAEGGANVVDLRVHRVRYFEELLTPWRSRNLRKAKEEPDLYFVGNNGNLTRPGMGGRPVPPASPVGTEDGSEAPAL